MDILNSIIARAQSKRMRIVLPEAEEERTLRAADRAIADKLADIVLIGNPEVINRQADEWRLTHISEATLIDPENNSRSEVYAMLLTELRKKKGMTLEQAR